MVFCTLTIIVKKNCLWVLTFLAGTENGENLLVIHKKFKKPDPTPQRLL